MVSSPLKPLTPSPLKRIRNSQSEQRVTKTTFTHVNRMVLTLALSGHEYGVSFLEQRFATRFRRLKRYQKYANACVGLKQTLKGNKIT